MSSAPFTRQALRADLLARREAFVAGPGFAAANETLARHLADLLATLEPELLGLYWPHRSEFNAAQALAGDRTLANLSKALPHAERTPVRMKYLAWDGRPPTATDAFGIPTGDGPEVVPDVVLVPCVGYTREGFRLGYGGGYFDRWLAANPGVTAVGVAWSIAAIEDGAFAAEPHDEPLTLIVNENGVV